MPATLMTMSQRRAATSAAAASIPSGKARSCRRKPSLSAAGAVLSSTVTTAPSRRSRAQIGAPRPPEPPTAITCSWLNDTGRLAEVGADMRDGAEDVREEGEDRLGHL